MPSRSRKLLQLPGVRAPGRNPHPYWVAHQQYGDADHAKLLRQLNYLALFVMMLVFMAIMCSVLFWTVLGTVLNPEGLIPVFAAFTTVLLHAKSFSGALRGVKAKLEDRIARFRKKGAELRKKTLALTARINGLKKQKAVLTPRRRPSP